MKQYFLLIFMSVLVVGVYASSSPVLTERQDRTDLIRRAQDVLDGYLELKKKYSKYKLRDLSDEKLQAIIADGLQRDKKAAVVFRRSFCL